jgi:multiple sugar transport system permease protein
VDSRRPATHVRLMLRSPLRMLGVVVRDRAVPWVFTLPGLAIVAAYFGFPIWSVLVSSFRSVNVLETGQWIGPQNYSAVLSQSFGPSLLRSVEYVAGNVVIGVPLGIGIALLLNMRLRGRDLARGLILFPFVISPVVGALIWHYLLDALVGIVNYAIEAAHIAKQPIGFLSDPHLTMWTVVGVAIWKYLPITVIVVLSRLQSIPPEILEASKCDGATTWQMFRYMVWPWISGSVIIVIVLATILRFNEYDVPYLLVGGGPMDSVLTLPILLRNLVVDDLNVGQASALAVVMLLILSLVTALYLLLYRREAHRIDG